jgi:quercetin dioxygenase-like cupin family protein
MTTTLRPTTTTDLWFLDELVCIRVARADGSDGISIMEFRGPLGHSPPLHIHHTEDEIFHILEGEFRLCVAGQIRRARPGDILLAPKGIPHTYRIDSAAGGRCLTITAHGDFERFVRAVSRPAPRLELPPPSTPTPASITTLTAVARTHGIEIVGPPLS